MSDYDTEDLLSRADTLNRNDRGQFRSRNSDGYIEDRKDLIRDISDNRAEHGETHGRVYDALKATEAKYGRDEAIRQGAANLTDMGVSGYEHLQ